MRAWIRLSLLFKAALFMLVTVAPTAVESQRAGVVRKFVYSPYKDVSQFLDPVTPAISIVSNGRIAPVVHDWESVSTHGAAALTWAFATGECGDERWGNIDGQVLADTNVPAFNRAGVDYIISTGGAEGDFTCAADAGMEKFIARYRSPHLIGIDFDIEREQSAEVIASVVRRVHSVQRRYPELRFSFTLATHAASDGSLRSLNATGEKVLRAIRSVGLNDYFINLMVMNLGEADPRYCVVAAGACDMSASAIQAALNVNKKYGVPLNRIELTAMIGVNDVVTNVFRPDEAKAVAQAVRKHRLAGLHFWSLDRDAPCPDNASSGSAPSPTCSGLKGVVRLTFTRAFAEALR